MILSSARGKKECLLEKCHFPMDETIMARMLA